MKKLAIIAMETIIPVTLTLSGVAITFGLVRHNWLGFFINLTLCVTLITVTTLLNIRRRDAQDAMQEAFKESLPTIQFLTHQSLRQWGVILALVGARLNVRQGEVWQETARRREN